MSLSWLYNWKKLSPAFSNEKINGKPIYKMFIRGKYTSREERHIDIITNICFDIFLFINKNVTNCIVSRLWWDFHKTFIQQKKQFLFYFGNNIWRRDVFKNEEEKYTSTFILILYLTLNSSTDHINMFVEFLKDVEKWRNYWEYTHTSLRF